MALAQKEKEELSYNVSAELIKNRYIDKGSFYMPQMSINENGKEAYFDIGLKDGIHVIRLKVKFNKPADIKKIIDTFKKITAREGERYKKYYLKNITEELRKEKGRRYSLSGKGLAAAIRWAAKNNCSVYKEQGINLTYVSANNYLKYGSVVDAYNAWYEREEEPGEEEPAQYVTFKETDKDYVGNIKPRGILLGTARNEETGKNRDVILGKVVIKPGGKGVQKVNKRGKEREIKITVGKPIITSGPRKVAKLGTPTRKKVNTKKRRRGKKNRK